MKFLAMSGLLRLRHVHRSEFGACKEDPQAAGPGKRATGIRPKTVRPLLAPGKRSAISVSFLYVYIRAALCHRTEAIINI
ncbi:MAG: hypothetical protein V2J24_00785 [Pseudomonadales bacterium]|jgi:hypothetical protein|nr:hypothetical protein [Pseudomonadales bacterium]